MFRVTSDNLRNFKSRDDHLEIIEDKNESKRWCEERGQKSRKARKRRQGMRRTACLTGALCTVKVVASGGKSEK
jgi:hypothetical protein